MVFPISEARRNKLDSLLKDDDFIAKIDKMIEAESSVPKEYYVIEYICVLSIDLVNKNIKKYLDEGYEAYWSVYYNLVNCKIITIRW